MSAFRDDWRRAKSAAFDLHGNSTAGRTIALTMWDRPVEVYANANFSVYSAQTCNARCSFCVEELRPASRGRALETQKRIEADDQVYFAALHDALQQVRPVEPTLSITGGEPSKDPRIVEILEVCSQYASPRRTLTTNGSGLLDVHGTRPLIDHVVDAGIGHLNISRAHYDARRNAELMVLSDGLTDAQLGDVVARARAGGTRVRLSCVLLDGAVDSLGEILRYLAFARSIGVDNVIFRQLMLTDPERVLANRIVRYSDRHRTELEPLLDEISASDDFDFVRQVMGYYYYVEVFEHAGMDVVFEAADLARLERTKRTMPGVIHELIFHPNAKLASTWQPWDGVLGPVTVD